MNLDRRTEDFLILKDRFDNIEFGQAQALSPGPFGTIKFFKVIVIKTNENTMCLGYVDNIADTMTVVRRFQGKFESFSDEEIKNCSNEDALFVYDIFTRKVE